MGDLPKVPQELVDIALRTAEENSRWQDKPLLNAVQDRILTRAGETYICRNNPRFSLEDAFGNWVNTNITKEWSQIGVAINQPSTKNSELTGYNTMNGPHSDLTRTYALIYLLEAFNEDQYTIFWHEQGESLHRKRNTLITELDNLKQIDSVCIPKNTWVYFDASILHSVENVQGYRTAIHISLDCDPFNVFIKQ